MEDAKGLPCENRGLPYGTIESRPMDDFTFVEREDYEKGFAKVYHRDIVPYLMVLEERRQKAIARSQKIIGAIAVVALILAWQAHRLDPVLPIMPIALGGFACLFVYISRGDKLQGALTDFIRPILSRFLEDVSFAEESSAQEVKLDTLKRLCLVPQAERHYFGPRISGSWRDVSYQLVKASFLETYRDSDDKLKTRTLFSGVLIEIECWKPMPTIVFLPDFGKLGNRFFSWATRNLRPPHKLELSDDSLERAFEVYTDDLDEARQALDTSFGHKILNIADEYQGAESHLSTAFEGTAFYLALRLDHSFLSFDVMNKPLSNMDENIHQALSDLTLPRQIIDRLLD